MVRIVVDEGAEGLFRLLILGLPHEVEGILVLLVGIGAGQGVGLIARRGLLVVRGRGAGTAGLAGGSRGGARIGVLVQLLLLRIVLALRHRPERLRLTRTARRLRLTLARGGALGRRRWLGRIVGGLHLRFARALLALRPRRSAAFDLLQTEVHVRDQLVEAIAHLLDAIVHLLELA